MRVLRHRVVEMRLRISDKIYSSTQDMHGSPSSHRLP